MSNRYLVNFNLSELEMVETEFLIIGSGIAGLWAAHKAGRHWRDIILITKRGIEDTTTVHAQGGIAAAVGPDDDPFCHYRDTLEAGAGLCDPVAVEILVTEGRERIEELARLGVNFDKVDSQWHLTSEGGHSRKRVLHAGGDATGQEIQRVLTKVVGSHPHIQVLEDHFLVDILVDRDVCWGALVHHAGKLKVIKAPVTVLATGGGGQVYLSTTTPEIATGDGIAAAYRAGVEVMDMEFVQFHPTVLALKGAPPFNISEAVRGEGAWLVNSKGERFMSAYHPLGELAPRDVVARSIYQEMQKTGSDKVFLTLRHLEEEWVHRRFPTISRRLKFYGLDLARDLIPVAPAVHYFMGGVKTGYWGETSLKGLYACGEVACTGVHGANRLASNSLLEGLVFSSRAVEHAWQNRALLEQAFIRAEKKAKGEGLLPSPSVDWEGLRGELRALMQAHVSLCRCREGLELALGELEKYSQKLLYHSPAVEAMEFKNMLQVAWLIAEGALIRTESRGAHWRSDYPQTEERWQRHLIFKRQVQ
ncbi:MAG TPA: L-aspartate oxidase [Moorella mulderi]|nr:L-aspartate oxidase [Moorella mulderi]